MMIVPLAAVPNQTLTITLSSQITQINLYQKAPGLFMDVLVNNALIIGGVLCQNLNRIIRSLYLGYDGDFFFIDQQGTDDPVYTGLGARWVLAYVDSTELPAGEG